MFLYEKITSPEFEYLLHISKSFSKIIQEYNLFISDRDTRIDLVIDNNISSWKESVDIEISKIILRINNIDIDSIDIGLLEDISRCVNDIIGYINYGISIQTNDPSNIENILYGF